VVTRSYYDCIDSEYGGKEKMSEIRKIALMNFSKIAANCSKSGAEVGRCVRNTNTPFISEGGGDTK